jgi:hypothetical protein
MAYDPAVEPKTLKLGVWPFKEGHRSMALLNFRR